MANRKLQMEIDRVLKRVGEGQAEFQETWDRVHETTNPSQKEKFEAELKREIKKLQRLRYLLKFGLRDQIKTWAASPEVKNKEPLLQARKAIERDMERFKECEKEAKLKQFSTAALQAVDAKVELTNEQMDLLDWLDSTIDSFQSLLHDKVNELDSFQRKGKRRNRNLDESRGDRLQKQIDRLTFHVNNLTKVKERVENASLPANAILKDDIGFILDDVKGETEAQGADDVDLDEEYIYDCLKDEGSNSASLVNSLHGTEDEYSDIGDDDDDHHDDDGDEAYYDEDPEDEIGTDEEKESEHTTESPNLSRKAKPERRDFSNDQKAKKHVSAESNPDKKNEPRPMQVSASMGGGSTIVALTRSKPTSPVPKPIPSPASPQAGDQVKPSAKRPSSTELPPLAPANPAKVVPFANIVKQQQKQHLQMQQEAFQQQEALQNQHETQQRHAGPLNSSGVNVITRSLEQMTVGDGAEGLLPGTPSDARLDVNAKPTVNQPSARVAPSNSGIVATNHSPQLTPEDSVGLIHPLDEQQEWSRDMLEASLHHMTTSTDSERPKQYVPRNPSPTPSCFPRNPNPMFEEPSFFSRYETDTLFFIFYFQQGTYQQYLAATQLKRQSWRYHTKYLTWFQRHEDPTHTTDEFERGTYVYFDYDLSWCQRIKADFTFEYRYLEDDVAI